MRGNLCNRLATPAREASGALQPAPPMRSASLEVGLPPDVCPWALASPPTSIFQDTTPQFRDSSRSRCRHGVFPATGAAPKSCRSGIEDLLEGPHCGRSLEIAQGTRDFLRTAPQGRQNSRALLASCAPCGRVWQAAAPVPTRRASRRHRTHRPANVRYESQRPWKAPSEQPAAPSSDAANFFLGEISLALRAVLARRRMNAHGN